MLGGGSAGCVLAARLSENPDCSVCLVEAGPDYGPYGDGAWPEDLLDARWLALSHAWETDRDDRSQLRARVIGGCSAHNACVVLRGDPSDYDEWGPGWTYRELEPYLDRGEQVLRTRPTERDDLSPWHRAFAEAGGDASILHRVNAVGSVRWNTAFAYLDAARARPNLTILADTVADRLLVDGATATGALAGGRSLSASVVVLAASAYGSPGILLRSGIGPADELRRHAIDVVADLPVGLGLVDHVGVGFGWQPSDRLREELQRFERSHPLYMAQVTVPMRSSACPPGVHDLFHFPAAEPDCEISAAVFAMKPLSRGFVRLHSPDPEQPLLIEHGFLTDPRDADVLAEGVKHMRAIAGSEPIRDYVDGELRPGPEVDAAEHVRTAARGFFHPVATCAIGAVVENDARVRGFDNLYVADASIMPTIPRANTNLSTVAVAERVAEFIARG